MSVLLPAAAATVATMGGGTARASFIDGTMVVVRLGDGSVPFNSSNLAQPVSLDTYDVRSGQLISTTALPSGAADAGRFVLGGSGKDDDGHISLSANGQYLTMAGYRSAAGAAYPVTAAVDRAVARIDGNYNVNTSTTLTGAYVGVAITSAVSSDGQQFWTGGGNETTNYSGGLRYLPTLGGSSSVNVGHMQSGSNPDSMRNVRMIDGSLYINTPSQGSFTNRGSYVVTINGGLPAATTATLSTATPVIVNKEGSTTDAAGNKDFDDTGAQQTTGKLYPKTDGIYLDLNHDGIRETAYTTGGKDDLEKWNLVSGAWKRTDTLFLANGTEIDALDSFRDGNTTDLMISTDAGIYKLLDSTTVGDGFTSPLVSATDSLGRRFYTDSYFISAGSEQFRGIAVVPEPATGLAAAVMGMGLLIRRRRAV